MGRNRRVPILRTKQQIIILSDTHLPIAKTKQDFVIILLKVIMVVQEERGIIIMDTITGTLVQKHIFQKIFILYFFPCSECTVSRNFYFGVLFVFINKMCCHSECARAGRIQYQIYSILFIKPKFPCGGFTLLSNL